MGWLEERKKEEKESARYNYWKRQKKLRSSFKRAAGSGGQSCEAALKRLLEAAEKAASQL